MICSCSDETLCLIGDGGDSTSHGVCRLIDDRDIDGDSISCGVGGLVNNRVDGDSVSGSVGSLADNRVERTDNIEFDDDVMYVQACITHFFILH